MFHNPPFNAYNVILTRVHPNFSTIFCRHYVQAVINNIIPVNNFQVAPSMDWRVANAGIRGKTMLVCIMCCVWPRMLANRADELHGSSVGKWRPQWVYYSHMLRHENQTLFSPSWTRTHPLVKNTTRENVHIESWPQARRKEEATYLFQGKERHVYVRKYAFLNWRTHLHWLGTIWRE